MAISHVASMTALTAVNPSGGGTWTVPGSAQAGDLVVFWLYARAGVFAPSVSGEGRIREHYNTSHSGFGRLFLGDVYLTSGDLSDLTFAWTRATGSSNADVIWGCEIIRGQATTSGNPWAAGMSTPTEHTDTNDPDPPAVTPPVNDSLIFTLVGKNNDHTGVTQPTNYTLRGNGSSTGGTDGCAAVATRILSGGGGASEDPGAWTFSGGAAGDDGLTITGAISPASAATNANAGHASGTGAALAASVLIAASAALASGTGAAHAASVNVQPTAGHAAGTGAANNAVATELAFDSSDAFYAVAQSGQSPGLGFNPVGVPTGILVLIVSSVETDTIDGVTYNGADLTEIPLSPVLHTSPETGSVHGFFIGSGFPTTDPATVVVTASTANLYNVAVFAVRGGSQTEIHDTSSFDAGSTTTPGATLTITKPAFVAGAL
jgi:hypothetical protein